MDPSAASYSQIRKIDNTRSNIPIGATLAIAFMIVVLIWFFRGGSFRLYASLFFGLYHLTHSSWLSIILVSVVQNIFFLPLRIISERFYIDFKDFEKELAHTKSDEQYFVLKRQVTQGNMSVIFYILNFLLVFIAFISAGRVFLLEFYHTPIASHYLYNFIHYPEYPLEGIVFNFPFFRITSSFALGWNVIFWIWAVPILVLVAARLLWRLLKPIFSRSAHILRFRIGLNRILLLIGGFVGTLLIISTIFFRHIPTGVQFIMLSADLSKQNTAFNIITAICTCFATIYGGFEHNKEAAAEARRHGIPEDIITKVNKQYLRNSVKNGVLLGLTALYVTRLMPSSHDLSVLAFEALYLLSPVTFDLLIPKARNRA